MCLLSPDEADINETKVESTETQEPALPTTNISDEDKVKRMKDGLRCVICRQNSKTCWW